MCLKQHESKSMMSCCDAGPFYLCHWRISWWRRNDMVERVPASSYDRWDCLLLQWPRHLSEHQVINERAGAIPTGRQLGVHRPREGCARPSGCPMLTPRPQRQKSRASGGSGAQALQFAFMLTAFTCSLVAALGYTMYGSSVREIVTFNLPRVSQIGSVKCRLVTSTFLFII